MTRYEQRYMLIKLLANSCGVGSNQEHIFQLFFHVIVPQAACKNAGTQLADLDLNVQKHGQSK